MNLESILSPIIAIGGMGLLFGIGLGIAAKKFAIPVDSRVEAIKEHLPGANCGGCGMAGCEALAKGIVEGVCEINACPLCGPEQVAHIAEVMGVISEKLDKKVAIVRCTGDNSQSRIKYTYQGITTCLDANMLNGGPKMCTYGCLGYGDCVEACPFGAIDIRQGIASINPEKCLGCGVCVARCPREIIKLVPENTAVYVGCVSQDKGRVVKESCDVGCIGCGLCVKQCESEAITLANNYTTIDTVKCTNCGKCVAKCPTHAIYYLQSIKQEEIKYNNKMQATQSIEI